VSVAYVTPQRDTDAKANGFRYECDVCGWTSPVMKHREGAGRWAELHERLAGHAPPPMQGNAEPPRISGKGAAVDGLTPLGEGDDVPP
jgi:hypothetical protein